MKTDTVGFEEEAGFGDKTKQFVGSLFEKHDIKLSKTNAHVGRNIRNRYRMSQKDLYEQLGGQFSLNSIKNYEKGLRPAPVNYLLLLSKLFNVGLESLIDHSPFSKINHEPIPTKLYEYVNHQAVITDPIEITEYDIKANINQNKFEYMYYVLSENDQTLNLPWGTRLLVRLKKSEPIVVTDYEQYFIIKVSKESHPDYGYLYKDADDKDPTKASMRDGDKVIITRAKLATDIKNGKYVVYYDGLNIRHMSYRLFTDAIDGVVEKIIFEQFLYNKQRNTIPGVFPIKRK